MYCDIQNPAPKYYFIENVGKMLMNNFVNDCNTTVHNIIGKSGHCKGEID